MTASHAKEPLVIGWIDATLASSLLRDAVPVRSGRRAAVLSLSRFWQFLRSIAGMRGKPLARADGPDQPPEGPLANTIWDDPSLWLLMMH